MSASLVPCPSCARHVRVVEPACPFCASPLPSSLAARAIPNATQRLSRAAAFAFTASLAVAGCSSSPTPTGDAAVVDTSATTDTPSAADTPAPSDRPSGSDAPAPQDAGPGDSGAPQDNGGAMPLYGAPADVVIITDGAVPADVQDAGAPADAAPVEDGATVDDGGGIAPLYGAPVDAGGGGLRYGAPPPPDAF